MKRKEWSMDHLLYGTAGKSALDISRWDLKVLERMPEA